MKKRIGLVVLVLVVFGWPSSSISGECKKSGFVMDDVSVLEARILSLREDAEDIATPDAQWEARIVETINSAGCALRTVSFKERPKGCKEGDLLSARGQLHTIQALFEYYDELVAESYFCKGP